MFNLMSNFSGSHHAPAWAGNRGCATVSKQAPPLQGRGCEVRRPREMQSLAMGLIVYIKRKGASPDAPEL